MFMKFFFIPLNGLSAGVWQFINEELSLLLLSVEIHLPGVCLAKYRFICPGLHMEIVLILRLCLLEVTTSMFTIRIIP